MYNKEGKKRLFMNYEEIEVFIEERISMYLMLLKITPNLKGYKYFKECIKQIYLDSTKKFNIQEKLYNKIAEKYQEKAYNIDRSLRHAIVVSASKDGIADFEKYMHFEFYNEKPSPRELLCVLVEKVIVDSKKMLANKSQVLSRWREALIV